MMNSVEYLNIDDEGLHIMRENEPMTIPADTIIICAGQLSERALYTELSDTYADKVEIIGGAHTASELDAKAAIKQACYAAAAI